MNHRLHRLWPFCSSPIRPRRLSRCEGHAVGRESGTACGQCDSPWMKTCSYQDGGNSSFCGTRRFADNLGVAFGFELHRRFNIRHDGAVVIQYPGVNEDAIGAISDQWASSIVNDEFQVRRLFWSFPHSCHDRLTTDITDLFVSNAGAYSQARLARIAKCVLKFEVAQILDTQPLNLDFWKSKF